jgi:hypothetical protein
MREDGPEHERIWFRVLCLANVGQSGRRFEDGVRFLESLDRVFDGFGKLWHTPDEGGPGDAVGDLIRRSIDAHVEDRSSNEQAVYWRRLYDFVKIRTLLRDHQFLPGFWDTVDDHPDDLALYLHHGRVPGIRFQHRGLGESLSSQAFFLCRECYRLKIIGGNKARENCYAPNRHLVRFIRRAQGPDLGEWPDFDKYQTLSHLLHHDVTRHAGEGDFHDAFDLPLFHLALQDNPHWLVPGLLLGDDVEGVRELLGGRG